MMNIWKTTTEKEVFSRVRYSAILKAKRLIPHFNLDALNFSQILIRIWNSGNHESPKNRKGDGNDIYWKQYSKISSTANFILKFVGMAKPQNVKGSKKLKTKQISQPKNALPGMLFYIFRKLTASVR